MTVGDWTGGDVISSALLDLASDRGLPEGLAVTSDLVQLAQRHGLLGILQVETDDALVRAGFARLVARRNVMMTHLRRILERLDGAGVRAALFKGADVATHYRDPSLRTFDDIDILIEESSLDKALEVLASDESALRLPEQRPKADKRDFPFRDRSGLTFNVDVHWDLFAYSQLRGVAEGASLEGWRAATRVDGALGPRWVFPREIEILFLAAHAILDHRFRLILMRDFLEIAEGKVPWEDLLVTADRWGLRATTYVPLWIAQRSIGAAIDQDALDGLRPASLAISYLEHALPRIDLVRFDGHRVHPVNLACVLLGDTPIDRFALAARVPTAFPAWRRRVRSEAREPKSPRVLIVVNTDRRRGAEVFAERLHTGLTELGWIVDAVSLTTVGSGSRARVNPLSDMSPQDIGRLEPGLIRALRRRAKSFDADIVLANGGSTLRYGVLATTGLRSRLVYMGIGESNYWIRSRWSAILNRILLRRAHKVLAVSGRTRDMLVQLEPTLQNRIEVTHTGVPDSFFELNAARSGGHLRVVMIGNLSTEKDPGLALRAVAAVEEATIRFVGEGPLESSLRAEARQLGADDRVEFTGSVDDIAPHLSWANVLMLTSKTEGLPAAVLEAGAAGLAVVSVDVGGVVEAVEDGVTGLVVPGGDLKALIAALERLARDPETLTRMGMEARDRVRKEFTMDRATSRFAEALLGAMR